MKLLIGSVLLLMSAAASSVTVTLDQPGYFALDGRYYVFGLPQPGGTAASGPVQLQSLGAEGFYLVAYLSATACHGGASPAGAPLSGLRHAELPALPDAPQLALDVDETGLSTVAMAHCDGTTVLLADSGAHDIECGGSIPFPFKRGQCPGLDAAHHGHVFFDAFESVPTPAQ